MKEIRDRLRESGPAMKGIISICGKGGVGKTTLAALLSRLVLEEKNSRGLAIDADPAGDSPWLFPYPSKNSQRPAQVGDCIH